MATKTEDKVAQAKSTEKPKAEKPQAPYFRTFGDNKELAQVLEGLDRPVRRGSWAAMVARMLVSQDEPTEETVAKAWEQAAVKNGETYPGKDGVYHDGSDHKQKTVLQSTQYGTRRALRDLHARGLIRVKDGKIEVRPPLSRFVGQVRPAAPARRTARKGRTARTTSKSS